MAQEPTQLFVVSGPESSGKSTLAAKLATWLDAPLIEEAARAYLQDQIEYTAADVLQIADLQQRAEDAALASGISVVVADTDYQILNLWWQEKFAAAEGRFPVSPPKHAGTLRRYLLCYPDLDWQPDPLRENPYDRKRLFTLQMQALIAATAEFRVIWGQGRFREHLARYYIETSLSQSRAKHSLL